MGDKMGHKRVRDSNPRKRAKNRDSNSGKKSGKHPQNALTPVLIRNLNEPGYYCDGNGLYLQVAPGGSKSWVVRTTTIHGRQEIGCGGLSYISLADAREKAIEIRKSARSGGDP